jgi:hypothetical protein
VFHPLRWARRIISLLLLAAAAYYVITGAQVVTSSRSPGAVSAAPREPVVLVVSAGGEPAKGAQLTAELRARLEHAARLVREGHARRVVVCASTVAGARASEAYLASVGIGRASLGAVVAGDLSAQLRAYRHSGGPQRAILVADSWQTLWVSHVAGAAGLTVFVSPIRPVDHSLPAELGSAAVQAAAVAWGRIGGFGDTGFIAG